MTNLIRTRWFLIGCHLAVIAGLIASLAITYYHQDYMTRGVDTGENATPINHSDVNPMGVNTLLHEEVEPEKVARTLDMIAAAGFTYVRQIFVWSEIEPAPNTYWSEQHDVSTWEKYDRIVEMASERGLEIVARLDKPPRWSREGQPGLDQFPDGPPNDYGDYADFVAEVVNRYEGQVNYVQLWNEPNLGVEWGGQPIDPAEFTELLAAGYEAAKEANPDVTILMPGLAPTEQRGPNNLSDLLFLEGMYEAGAAQYFDIATVMVYGYGYSPYDRRVSFERNNFSRPIQTREIMEQYGDEETPIWAVEYGWVSLPEDWDGEPSPWGEPVSEQKQARYLYQGYLRAQREWPWMGAMMVWGFRWPTDPDHPDQAPNPTRGFRIVNHDFTPRPAYNVLSNARDRLDRAFTGAYEADSRLLRHDENWELAGDGEAQTLAPETTGAGLTIPFSGTSIEVDFSGESGSFAVTLDDEPIEGLPQSEDDSSLVTSSELSNGTLRIEDLPDEPHQLQITTIEVGDNPLAIEGFTVERHPLTTWIYPYLYAGTAMVLLFNVISLAGIMWRGRSAEPLPSYSRVFTPQELRQRRGPLRPGS